MRLDHRSFEEITLPINFDDEDDDGSNSTNSLTPEGEKPKKETEAEKKIRLKKEEWANKADGMAITRRAWTCSIDSLCLSLDFHFSWQSSASSS